MKAEIYARGSIVCMMNPEAPQYYEYISGVIVCDKGPECMRDHIGHVVVITGWGTNSTSGISYWVVRNSYGTHVR
jgi:hypothetical protein